MHEQKKDLRMKGHIWVTGGAGYIGSTACKMIAERTDFVPVTIDDLSMGKRELVKWGPLVRADINDRSSLAAAVRDYPPGAVMHFAARTSVEESMTMADEYWQTNVVGTKNVLDVCRSCGCDKFIFSSSAAVYGSPASSAGITEDEPLSPVNLYGETKRVCEEMIQGYARSYGLSYVIFRYFNVAGADPDGETGRWRAAGTEGALIPRLTAAALGDKKVEIYGTDYDTRDGTAIRDFIHVSDIVAAHIKAIPFVEGGRSGVFNIGTGDGTSVMEIVRACESVLGVELDKRLMPRRAGDAPCVTADPSRARDELDWRATELSTPERMIETATAWERGLASR